MRSCAGVALALLIATPASAQQKEPTTYDRAIAAGYKALTLCSGIFNAGRTKEQIEALELTGIYREYDAIVPTLEAKVERIGADFGLVSAGFDAHLPPRAAFWQYGKGCSVLPIGMAARSADYPVVQYRVPRREHRDDLKWPQGDVDANDPSPPPAKLAGVAGDAFASPIYGEGTQTTAITIVRDSKIVAERYADGFDAHTSQRTWSVAKSLTGTLIGIASRNALLSSTQRSGISEWQTPRDPRSNITIDQLLRMASGLHSDTAGNRTDAIYFGGTAVTEQVTGWPLEAMPGTRFRYANNDTLLAIRALREKLNEERYKDFPRTALFDKIGMARTVAETDWQGNFILSSQVWSTARDLARFGLLYLNDGVWNGERILPEGWVKYVTTPSGPQPVGEFGYGASFWLMNKSPGVPADTFAAFGNRGQYVVIVPSRKVVIVRRGEDPTGARFDIAKFTAEVLAALE